MNKYNLLGKLSVIEGKQDELISILLEAAEAMEKVAECELYIVNISADEPNAVYVYEVWTNEQAHKASLSLEVTQNLIGKARPILTGVERITTLTSLGGKGLVTV